MNHELIEFLAKEISNGTSDIKESLELLSTSINICLDQLQEKLVQAFNDRNFEKTAMITNQSQAIVQINDQIQEIINKLDEKLDETSIIDEELETTTIEREIPNYKEYYIDQNVEYSLYEDFTHKRPAAFKLGTEKQMAKDWKEVLINTLELLNQKDSSKLLSFTKMKDMQGKKVIYFSTTQETNMRRAIQVPGTTVWVETNLSANGIRNLLIKVLKEYGIKLTEYKVYLRADYSDLH